MKHLVIRAILKFCTGKKLFTYITCWQAVSESFLMILCLQMRIQFSVDEGVWEGRESF